MAKSDLALYGGKPVRNQKLYYGHQWIDEADIEAVEEVLRGDYLTCGPTIERLEEKLCKVTGAEYAVACSNGTAALHIAMMAAGVGEGDEVITTPLTFAASANCALYCGATPVFADVKAETYNIDPASIRKKITPRTKAIVAVDFTGQAVENREIREICDEYGLIFIEDSAHAIGTKYDGKPIGSLADMTCFSFHPVKTVTSGEGGAVTTNDDKYFEKLKLYRTHGITHDEALMEETPEGPWYYEMIDVGYNYRLTDIQAALLISQLEKLEQFSNRRKAIVKRYNDVFSGMEGLIVQQEIPESDTTRHLYIIQLDPEKLSCTRREFFDAMAAENVQCQVHYVPVYWFPVYKRLGHEVGECPNAERIYRNCMSIPLYPAMSDDDVEDVIKAVQKCVQAYLK